jgi:hypothetical protein
LLQRYLVTRKILNFPPIEFASSSDFSIQMRIYEKDAILAHWALRSLHHHWRHPVHVTIHHNDECSVETLRLLQDKFRNVRFVSREVALRELAPKLREFPLLQQWRLQSASAIKAIDFYLLASGKYSVFLDADILFFSEPSAMFRDSAEHVWMKDCYYCLAIEPEESASVFGGPPLQAINTGLGQVPSDSIDLKLVQQIFGYLRQPEIAAKWRARGIPEANEMAYNAVISAQYGPCRLLPDSYPVAVEPGLQGIVAKHYTSPVRFWMYEEGIPRVAKQLGMHLPRWLAERA